MKNITLLMFMVPFFTLGQWIQVANDIDGEVINDQSGTSVALNAEGNIIAIGAPFNDNNGAASGQVRIFENQSDNWVQIGAAINGSASPNRSGFSVSISNDGNIVAIGSPDTNGSGFDSGEVRVFENIAGNWTQIGDEINGEATFDNSGYSVSLSGDGAIVAIGALDNGGAAGSNTGHVRVYENIAGSWEQIGDDIDGEEAEDKSGFSVSLSEDGTIVAIGAPFNDGTASSSGHVRVYQNESGSWEQIGDDIDGEAMNDRFGVSVALSTDGTIVAIGARDNNSTGHVRVYENVAGSWEQIGDDIDGESIGTHFGSSVGISANGSIVAIGIPLSDTAGSEQGQVKLYQNQSGNWIQINNSIDGEEMNDRSGTSVSLSADGSIVAIGALLNDGNGANSGHARIFSNSNILSLQDHDFGSDFLVYPNPTTTFVTLNLGDFYTSIYLVICDAMGKQILMQNFTNTDTIDITTENFATGIYYIKIYNSENQSLVFKLLKE